MLRLYSAIATFLLIFLLAVFFCAPGTRAQDSYQQLQQKMENLSRKMGQTTDPQKLAQLMKQMQALMQLMANMDGAMGMMASGRAASPEQEVDRVIEATNSSYRELVNNLKQLKTKDGRPLPVTMAAKLRGFIVVAGKDSDPPRNGWIPLQLRYRIREDFVGYLMVSRYYDTRVGRFTGKLDYYLASISTSIRMPSIDGRQCVAMDSAPFVRCVDWRSFSTYDVHKEDIYPAIHEWVIMGSTDENRVNIEVEVPALYFRSVDHKAGRGIGCTRTTFEMDRAAFETALQQHVIELNKPIGIDSTVTPRCESGSTLRLHVTLGELFKPEVRAPEPADLDACRQTQLLLEDVKFLLKLRDTFKQMASRAENLDALLELVGDQMRVEFPGTDLKDAEYLAQSAGAYNFCSHQIHVPDLCQAASPRPLCRWRTEGLKAHEKTHREDAQNDPSIQKLFCDSTYQMQHYRTIKDLERAQSETYAQLDYHAYDEQARYLKDLIEQQLREGGGCRFDPNFFVDLQQVLDDLK